MKDQLEAMLRAWGRYYGERPPREWDETGDDPSALTSSHPIARAMEFAGGDSGVLGRNARSMARLRQGSDKAIPTWGFDPIVCSETRSHRIATPDDVPPIVARVQTAALDLYRVDTLRGTVLRFEYCKRGSQVEKAALLGTVGLPTGTRIYREALSYAKGWMGAKLEADNG